MSKRPPPLPKITMRRFLEDPLLLGKQFAGKTWLGWRALLIASQGEPLNELEAEFFKELTGRDYIAGMRCDELWVIASRRAGKSRAIAALATFRSIMFNYDDFLAPSERAVIAILSATQVQSGKVFEYTAGNFDSVKLLKPFLANITRGEIRLTNRIDIQIRTASYKTIRGITSPLVVLDELAFFDLEGSANPDKQIYDAVVPSLASLHGQLAVISSPFGKRGLLWDTYRENYGPDGDPQILVAKASTRQLNSTIDQRIIDRAVKKDPCAARTEWLGEFRDDIEAFISRDLVESLVIPGRIELPPGAHDHVAFCDPSGGGSDGFTLCIAHAEGEKIVIDCLREIPPPFNPEHAVREHAKTIDDYHCVEVVGDRYSGTVYEQMFAKFGATYRFSDLSKSELYSGALPMLNARHVELLDGAAGHKCVEQLCALERRVARASSRESIDHPQGAANHDDLSNALAGAIVLASAKLSALATWAAFGERAHQFMRQAGLTRTESVPTRFIVG